MRVRVIVDCVDVGGLSVGCVMGVARVIGDIGDGFDFGGFYVNWLYDNLKLERPQLSLDNPINT